MPFFVGFFLYEDLAITTNTFINNFAAVSNQRFNKEESTYTPYVIGNDWKKLLHNPANDEAFYKCVIYTS